MTDMTHISGGGFDYFDECDDLDSYDDHDRYEELGYRAKKSMSLYSDTYDSKAKSKPGLLS